jgi:hypothetical protein
MPNIELHGYKPEEAAIAVKQRIRAAFAGHSDAGEIVTTTIPSTVEDLQGRRMPFLRIIATAEELSDLIKLLRPLEEDMEVMYLREWIPKK